MYCVELPRLGTFDAWRAEARRLAGLGIAAEDVEWQLEGQGASLFAGAPLPEGEGAGRLTVPKGFMELAQKVVWHSDPARFGLLYDTLLRLQAAGGLLRDRTDPRIARLSVLEKSVRRDMHKMKAFVRFREMGQPDDARRSFFAWFEPSHHIVEPITGFFARRFGDMDWVIATPSMTVEFRDGSVAYDLTERAKPDLEDETEELWKTYFANIFNPARLKLQAMTSEMPKKYWKNLPEAELIPDMIAGAEARVREMAAAQPSIPPARARAITERLREGMERPVIEGGLDGLRGALQSCTRCSIGCSATQAVPGEGPLGARLMFVGEQPGDREDLAGRPFVGPAGQLLNRAMEEAGIARSPCYMTNAVKHFKFQPRGKRRIHQSPNRGEVEACRVFLEQEIELVRPETVVALGGSAALALTGDGERIMARRGTFERGLAGIEVFLTVHPSSILRQPEAVREESYRAFVSDLARVLG